MEKTISKAQLKRDKDLYNRIDSLIRGNLMDFKDMYLSDYVQYMETNLKKEVSKYQELIESPDKLKERNILKKAATRRNEWLSPDTIEDIKHYLKSAERNMLFPSIRLRAYLNDAHENFEKKIFKVIEKVCNYSPDTRFLKIERIGDAGHAFSFLISNNDINIHARVIYAQGSVNAPHYRFIITKRNK